MPYRIAGIDVHKKKLGVVVAEVEVEEDYQFERRWYGNNPEQLRALSEMAHRTARRGSRDGINHAILKAGLGSSGAILETEMSESGRQAFVDP